MEVKTGNHLASAHGRESRELPGQYTQTRKRPILTDAETDFTHRCENILSWPVHTAVETD